MIDDQTLTMRELFSFLIELGLKETAEEIKKRLQSQGIGPASRESREIDGRFLEINGQLIQDTLIEHIINTAQEQPGEAYNMLLGSLNIMSRMSNTANAGVSGYWGNLALKSISSWKSAADAIKNKIGANGYSIGANISMPPGVYVEMHF